MALGEAVRMMKEQLISIFLLQVSSKSHLYAREGHLFTTQELRLSFIEFWVTPICAEYSFPKEREPSNFH